MKCAECSKTMIELQTECPECNETVALLVCPGCDLEPASESDWGDEDESEEWE